MAKIYVMVGISASGKSSISKKLSKKYNAVIVSSDDIRGEICPNGVQDQTMNNKVFNLFHKRIKDNLLQEKNVIADATNITMKSRRSLLQNISSINCYKIAYIVPKTKEQCIKDNTNREYPVPIDVIEKQINNFQIPFIDEGFDEIVIHKLKRKRMPISYFYNMMIDFQQKNHHHTLTLDKHCKVSSMELANKDYSDIYCNAALIHDIGKLYTQTFDENGEAHYLQHHCVGAYEVLCDCDLETSHLLKTCFLINYHMLPYQWKKDKTHTKYKKIFGQMNYKLLMDFNVCDRVSH